MALKHGQNAAGCFEHPSHIGVVFYAVLVADVESLMGKHDDRLIIGFQIASQPLQLGCWNVGVGSFEILPTVRFAVAAEAGIENYKMDAAAVERVIRCLLFDTIQKFFLLQCVDTVVSKDVVPVFANR